MAWSAVEDECAFVGGALAVGFRDTINGMDVGKIWW